MTKRANATGAAKQPAQPAQIVDAQPEVQDAAAQAEVPTEAQPVTYPRTVVATNNTPIPVYLGESGVYLAENFNAPANARAATYTSEDAFKRELANIDAIARAHGFEEAVTFEQSE